jgi:hypothetical protein
MKHGQDLSYWLKHILGSRGLARVFKSFYSVFRGAQLRAGSRRWGFRPSVKRSISWVVVPILSLWVWVPIFRVRESHRLQRPFLRRRKWWVLLAVCLVRQWLLRQLFRHPRSGLLQWGLDSRPRFCWWCFWSGWVSVQAG